MVHAPQLLRSDEEQLLADTCRRYALQELLPDFSRWRSEPYPRSKIEALADLGVLGMAIPEEFGGSGASLRSLGVAAEELSRGDINVSYFIQLSAIAAGLLGASGDAELQGRWLPGVATGELVVAFALTEPHVGSDAAKLTTRAVRDGSDWLITG